MLRNYFIAYIRNTGRNKLVSAINILGLALGTSTVLLAIIYLNFEHSYDGFYEDDISRIVVAHSYQDRPARHMATLPYDLGTEILEKLPEVEALTRVKASYLTSVVTLAEQPEKYFNEAGLAFADGNYFDFFKIDLLTGDGETFARNTRSVVLSESAALKYFGERNPLGKVMEVKDMKLVLEVVGIMPDYPANSSIRFDLIASVEALRSLPNAENSFFNKNSWAHQTFIKAIHHQIAEEKINLMEGMELYGVRENQSFYLESISDLHFHSQTNEPFYARRGNPELLLWFSVIAAMVLLFAIINYGNVLAASAIKRVKEVGVRKVVGAKRIDVLWQMILESLITSLIAMVIGLLLVELTLPYLGNFVQRELFIEPVLRINFYVFSCLLAIVIGVLSGIYPAVVLSGINGLNLKKDTAGVWSKKRLGGALIVFQFAASMVLISVALYMNRQLDFVLNKDLGYDTDHTLVIKNLRTSPDRIAVLQNELLLDPAIEKTSLSDFIPGLKTFRPSRVKIDFGKGEDKLEIALLGVDEHFAEVYKISTSFGNKSQVESLFAKGSKYALVNEVADATYENGLTGTSFKGLFVGQGEFTIHGVVDDFHVASLHNEMEPFALIPVSSSYSGKHLSVRYVPGTDKQELFAAIKAKYSEIMPEIPFNMSFSRDGITETYAEELRTGTMISVLTLLSILLSLAGILGITLVIVGHRRKEISIRKILGAGLGQLLFLQNKRFILLIVLAFVIAAPLAYLVTDWWKTDFVYKVDFSFLLLSAPLTIMLCCTFLVSGWLTFKTANTNPVDAIRYE